MGTVIPFDAGLFATGKRHLVLLAHQDDELPYAGLLSRLSPDIRIVYLTNGDGLAPEAKMEPADYAAMRETETRNALQVLSIYDEHVSCLRHSELDIFGAFVDMVRDQPGAKSVPPMFAQMAQQVEKEMLDFRPDIVWTLAFQGGHPEHDLMHLFAVAALRKYEEISGRTISFLELPEYELIVVPLRFPPWRRKRFHEIWLTADEHRKKKSMFDLYPSQERILNEFKTIITLYGRISALRFKPFGLDEFGQREVFAEVPRDRDYSRSTHLHHRLDYMFDNHLGVRIRFDRTLARIAKSLGI